MVKLVVVAYSLSLACCVLGSAVASGASLEAIYEFSGPPSGALPFAGLAMDSVGRLYGITQEGGLDGGPGNPGGGTVFQLSPPIVGDGGWTGQIIHYFGDGPEGVVSLGLVTLNSTGQVFGTTLQGSTHDRGSVFRLDNSFGWPVTVLHAFSVQDGGETQQGVVFGKNGLLYGTTPTIYNGPKLSDGTAFSLSPLGDVVEHAVVHVFGKAGDGTSPIGLTLSSSGTFYGATVYGGTADVGTVFSLRPNSAGKATEKVLYSFGPAPDVNLPPAAPIFGRGSLDKSLFGCGAVGGTHGMGGIFRLTPKGNSGWTENVIYNFGDHAADPMPSFNLHCGLVQADMSGKIYGTTAGGGTYSGGTFFELDPPAQPGDAWTESVLFSFDNHSKIGSNPYGAPLKVGNVYYGVLGFSKNGYGSVYKIRP